MDVKKKLFGVLADGSEIFTYTLRNKNGVKIKLCDYGGIVMQIKVPDKAGAFDDIVCGYSSLNSYLNSDGYQGAIIGRVCNRIAGGVFSIDGKEYSVYKNDGNNSLHGGQEGFNSKLWQATMLPGNEPGLLLHRISTDNEENYPGILDITVKYTLTENNSLSIEYTATTDKPTIVNLTNHTYFNLGGYASGSILGHRLFLDAESYLPTDKGLIPTGEIKSVDGTPFDFRNEKTIGSDFDLKNSDIALCGGFDHCFNFSGGETKKPVLRAVLSDPISGRLMKMYTNQPCVQLYTGNFMNNAKYPFKNGFPQHSQNALCLETQKMPDSINHNNFTSTILRPGDVYSHKTIYEFSVI